MLKPVQKNAEISLLAPQADPTAAKKRLGAAVDLSTQGKGRSGEVLEQKSADDGKAADRNKFASLGAEAPVQQGAPSEDILVVCRGGATPLGGMHRRPRWQGYFGQPPGVLIPGSAPVTASEAAQSARDKKLFLRDLVAAYYPVDHPKLHFVEGRLDLKKIGPLGRTDEVGKLKKVALTVPQGLGGDWTFSPLAKSKGFELDLNRALEQHAKLTKTLLDRGVEVYLLAQPDKASEAVYATDTLTAIGNTAMIGNPKHEARKLETEKFKGGVQLETFGGSKGPIEFGDVLLAHSGGTQFVFQGYQSWRSTEESVDALKNALGYLESRGNIDPFVHIPVRLTGDDTLHIDYVTNYAGEGSQRRMTLYREGIADPSAIERMMQALGIDKSQVIEISREEMLAGAANIESIDPRTVMVIDNPGTQRVIAALQRAGLEVITLPFDQMSQKDGTVHCCTAPLLRD